MVVRRRNELKQRLAVIEGEPKLLRNYSRQRKPTSTT
jgi:hypothetical protein